DRMHVLTADRTAIGGRDSARPRDDQWVGDAALVNLALPPAERRVARDGPAPRVVVVPARSTDLVEDREGFLDGARCEVPHARVVQRAGDAALTACAVVGAQYD